MYGSYNFWSWLRYWYLDSANLVSMILVDKGYYDYDFEKAPEKREPHKQKTPEELRSILVGFGFDHLKEKKPETTEEIQDYIIKGGL